MSALITAFYAIGSRQATLTVNVPFLESWGELKACLAYHYGENSEIFHTAEATWNGDSDYAQLVMMHGRIIGALDRAISEEDVAAIWGVNRVEKRAFTNRIRSLYNIECHLLPELDRVQQSRFLSDPVQFFLKATEAQSDAIMREIEARQDVIRPAVQETSKPTLAKAKRKQKQRPKIEGQREMLLPITGGGGEAVRAQNPTMARKAG